MYPCGVCVQTCICIYMYMYNNIGTYILAFQDLCATGVTTSLLPKKLGHLVEVNQRGALVRLIRTYIYIYTCIYIYLYLYIPVHPYGKALLSWISLGKGKGQRSILSYV